MIASLFLRRRFHASPHRVLVGADVSPSVWPEASACDSTTFSSFLLSFATSLTPYSFFPAPYLMRGSRNAYETSTMRLMTMTTTTMTVTEPMTMGQSRCVMAR